MDTNTRGRPAVSLLLTSVAFFMVALDALVVITALPAIHAQLGGSVATLEWTVNAYGLAFAAGIVTASALGDRLGRRRVYVAGLILFSVASAACALAPTVATLIAARAVQGVGAAIVTPLSLTILTSSFPAAKRGAVVGIWGGIAGLAVAGGPLVGGAVVQLSWHWGDFNLARESNLFGEFTAATGLADTFGRSCPATFRAEYLPAGATAHCIDFILTGGIGAHRRALPAGVSAETPCA